MHKLSFLWQFWYPLSPRSNLASGKHFLRQVCRVEGSLVLGRSPLSARQRQQRGDIVSSGLPNYQFPGEPSLLSQALFISISFLQLLLQSFLANKSSQLFPWLSRGPRATRYRPPGTFGHHTDTLLYFLSHTGSQRGCCSPGLCSGLGHP